MSRRTVTPWAWAALYAVVVTSVSAAFYITGNYRFDGVRMSFGRALGWQLAIYGMWAISAPAIAYAGRRWRIRRGRLANRWTAPLPGYMLAYAVFVALHSVTYAWVTWLVRPTAPDARPPFGSVANALMMERFPVNILLFWAIVGVLYAVEYARALQDRERVAGALEADLVRAQLHTLRAQLQPHFLFNALQSIATLIPREPASARRMTVQLADLLRSTLDRTGEQRVTLREELELLRRYLAIEQIRYADRLTIAYDVADDTLDCLVPDLLLQPLAENAVRHGIEPTPGAARLTIGARRSGDGLMIRVEDNGRGLPPGWTLAARSGRGLQMTARRLELLYGGEATLTVSDGGHPHARGEGTGVRVEIHLPRQMAGVPS